MKKHTIKAYVYWGEQQYVAECLDISVVTQGRTLDEALKNLQEAVALHLDGEDMEALGFTPDPSILITMEVEALPYAA